jgi:ATP-binding cassette subfamily C protein LapB
MNNTISWAEQLTQLTALHPSSYLNCLKPLLEALHWQHKSRYLFESLPFSLKNLDCYGFLHIMGLLNYETHHFPTALKNLDRRLIPCLFVRDDQQVFLILAFNQQELTVFDGQTKATKKIPISELNSSKWHGKIYIFKTKEVKNVTAQLAEPWFSTILVKFKPIAWLTIVINFFLNLLALATPIFIMVVYDRVITANSFSTLLSISIGVVITIFATTILQAIQNRILAYLGARLDIIANNTIMQQIYSLPILYLENASINTQLAKIKTFDSIRDFFTGPTIGFLLDFVFSLIFIFTIWLIAGNLVWVPIITIFVVYLCSFTLWRYFKKLIKESSQLNVEQQNLWLEILVNIRTIKYINAENIWLDRFKKKSADLAFANYHLNIVNNVILSVFDTIITISAVATLGFGVLSILQNKLTVGALIATMIILWRILNPIKSIYNLISKFDQVHSSIDQVNALMRIETEFQNVNSYDQMVVHGHLHVANVSFRYSAKADPVLLGISFKAEPNTIVGVTGTNMSGKSTLLKLILGLYQPQMGYVQLDGYDLRQLDPHELRHQIAFSPDEIAFFNGTVEQNLLLAKPDATLEQMHQALKLAHAYEAIANLPLGLKSVLKKHDRPILPIDILQKLVLARMFLKPSALMLIDKTLDRLDPLAMMQVMESIQEIKLNKTIIITTSSISILNKVDRIIFLDKGHIVADGPKELVLSDKRLQPYYMVNYEKSN